MLSRCYCHWFLWLVLLLHIDVWCCCFGKCCAKWCSTTSNCCIGQLNCPWLMLLSLIVVLGWCYGHDVVWLVFLPGGWCYCHMIAVHVWLVLLPRWLMEGPPMGGGGIHYSQSDKWNGHWVNVLISILMFYVGPHPICEADDTCLCSYLVNGSLTLMNRASLIALVRLWSSFATMVKLFMLILWYYDIMQRLCL